MIPETQRNEMIDLENAKTELLDALKPFVIVALGFNWEFTEDSIYPPYCVPVSVDDLRRATEIYEKYKGG